MPPEALPVGSDEYNKVIFTLHSSPKQPEEITQPGIDIPGSDEYAEENAVDDDNTEASEDITGDDEATLNTTEEVENGYQRNVRPNGHIQ